MLWFDEKSISKSTTLNIFLEYDGSISVLAITNKHIFVSVRDMDQLGIEYPIDAA